MDARILVVSDEPVKKDFGELFHCLAKFEKVRHTGIISAIDVYEETLGNGWDVVIVACKDTCIVGRLMAAIWDIMEEQRILVVNEHFHYPVDMFMLACVPPETRTRMVR